MLSETRPDDGRFWVNSYSDPKTGKVLAYAEKEMGPPCSEPSWNRIKVLAGFLKDGVVCLNNEGKRTIMKFDNKLSYSDRGVVDAVKEQIGRRKLKVGLASARDLN